MNFRISIQSFFVNTIIIVIIALVKLLSAYYKIASTVFFFTLLLVSIILVLMNKKEYTILTLLSVDELNSFNSLLLYLNLALFICFVTDCLHSKNKRFTVNELCLTITVAIIQLALLLYNLLPSENISLGVQYAINDFKILFVLILSYFYFKNCNIKKIEFSFRIIFISQLIFIIVGYFLGLKATRLVDFDMGIGYSSILFLFLPYVFAKLLFDSNNRISNFILLVLLLFVMYKCKILSSQNLLSLPFVATLLFFDSNGKKSTKILMTSLTIVSAISLPFLLQLLSSSVDILPELKGKIENIIAIFSFSGDYYVSSHSVQVRLLELANIISELNPLSFFIGKGIGSYFTDSYFTFMALNEYDYSIEQISIGVFYTPHNIAYFFLKYGIGIFVVIVIWALKRILNLGSREIALLGSLFVYSILNLGFSLLPSMALGMFIALSKQYSKESKNECTHKTYNNSVRR